jgi:hypothetical protein
MVGKITDCKITISCMQLKSVDFSNLPIDNSSSFLAEILHKALEEIEDE